MKVILLDNIKSLGQVGDVKEVNDGYARNFLIPRNMVRPATVGAAKDVEALKVKKLEAAALAAEEAKALVAKLADITVTVSGKASTQGTLFAAIESGELADAIGKALGVHVKPEQLHPHDHLKTVGEHVVTLELVDGITADVKVVIEAA